ncbi:hypothetical protein [Nocardia sp. NPDC050789]|uniref:hypothetical protein n=1 Tax=Nocardia sp. NPDC050789 TaxID=3154841 RepID=UPI0033E30EB7
MISSDRADFEQSAEPPEDNDPADTPSRISDVLAVALGMLIGLLVFLALLIAYIQMLFEAFGSENAAGLPDPTVTRVSAMR